MSVSASSASYSPDRGVCESLAPMDSVPISTVHGWRRCVFGACSFGDPYYHDFWIFGPPAQPSELFQIRFLARERGEAIEETVLEDVMDAWKGAAGVSAMRLMPFFFKVWKDECFRS